MGKKERVKKQIADKALKLAMRKKTSKNKKKTTFSAKEKLAMIRAADEKKAEEKIAAEIAMAEDD